MLFIDYRAGSNELTPLLGDLAVECDLGEAGDVLVPGNGPSGELLVAVEVKKINDLLQSETTGRLADTQLPRLLDNYGQVWLLAIGEYRSGLHGRLEVRSTRDPSRWRPYSFGSRELPYAYLESFLVEVQTIGVHYKGVTDATDAAGWLRILHRWWEKPWDKHRAMRKLDTSGEAALMPNMDRNRKQMLKIARQLPNMGYERAFAASNHFVNSRLMMASRADQWSLVPGVGKVIARGIDEALDDEG